MVSNRLGQRGLYFQESLVESRRVLAVQRDHSIARLASADYFESIGLNSRDDRLRDGGGGFAAKSQFRAGAIGSHHRCVCSRGINRQDMDAFSLQLAPHGFPKSG